MVCFGPNLDPLAFQKIQDLAVSLNGVGFVVPVPKGLTNPESLGDMGPGLNGRAMQHQQIAALGLQFQAQFAQGAHQKANAAVLGILQ